MGCSDSKPDWPEPVAATSTCAYRDSAAPAYRASSTLYRNERDGVFRVDGLYFEESGDVLRDAYFFEYDAQDRLVAQHSDHADATIAYTPQQIVWTEDSRVYTYDLTGDRLSFLQGPMDLPAAERNSWSYEYDAGGRITRIASSVRFDLGDGDVQLSRSDRHYAYDAKDRLVSIDRTESSGIEITYTENGNELLVEWQRYEFGDLRDTWRWTIRYDDQKRVTLVASTFETVEYTYGVDRIDELRINSAGTTTISAIGNCPPITVGLAPPQPLPLRWSANHVSTRFPGYLFLGMSS